MNLSAFFFADRLALTLFHLSPEAQAMALQVMQWFNLFSIFFWPSSFTLPNILRAQAKLELLQAALFRERRSVIRRFRQMVAGEYVWVRVEVLPCKDCSPEDPWAVVVAREEFPEE